MARRYARFDNAILDLQNMANATPAILEEMQIELAEAGAEKMIELVERRGTGKEWTSFMKAKEIPASGIERKASFPGRVNTGKMRDAIRARFESGGRKIISSFGWIDNVEPYFYAQEYGTSALGFRKPSGNPAKDNITGMFALRDARKYVVDISQKVARKYERRIARGGR